MVGALDLAVFLADDNLLGAVAVDTGTFEGVLFLLHVQLASSPPVCLWVEEIGCEPGAKILFLQSLQNEILPLS